MSKTITQFRWLVTMLLIVTAMVMPKMAWAEPYDENGFAEDGSYQPATPTTNQYDINGDGTKDEVYEIGNAGQLYWFAALVNGELGGETQNTSANAVLTANITVTNETWTPIGFRDPYEGTFDGQGHTISGLNFNDVDASYVGLFGHNRGTIKNVGVVYSYFYGYDCVGGVCGENNGTITGCYTNYGRVSGNNSVGGVCGSNGDTITGCYNTGEVHGNSDYVGGVCGYNSSTITGCYNNTGSVSGYNQVGGVCGYNSSTITDCHNTGTVSGNGFYAGGVCGQNGRTITGCYNTGEVRGKMHVGGVCGSNGGTITGCYNTDQVSGDNHQVGGVCGYNSSTITGCYNMGSVSSMSDIGGVCGENNGGTITSCYTNNGGVIGGGSGSVTDCDVKEDFTDGTVCSLLNTALKKVNASVRFYQGANYPEIISYIEGVYQISNKEELYAFAQLVNKGETSANAVLTKDITVTNETWTPIGNGFIPYTGTFDGQGHTINGLYLDNSGLNNVGLFGSNSGTIKNVGVVNSYFYGHDFVGGVCGYNEGTITGCYNTGSVSGNNDYVGGVCGKNYGGTITSCYNTGTASGNNWVGGVCGDNNGTITGCYNDNTGEVSGNDWVGGVCGDNENRGTITSCYNSGSVSGNNYVGGVCGKNGSTITSCYNDNTGAVSGNNWVGGVCGSNSGTITSCYNTGTVSCNFDWVGGVCGSNGGKITGCYNTGSVSGHNQVGGVCGYNSSTITGCYNYNTGAVSGSKDVSGSSYVGGVCGYNEGGTITGCYNSGTVSGSGSNVGGVCGANQALDNCTATITNCYYNSEKYTGNAIGTNNGTFTNVEGKTTARFMSGEVCYLMNNVIIDGTQKWHQNIDMEGATKDPYPVLDNTHGVVYQCSVCTSAYSNTEGAKGAHDYVDDGNGFLTCKACGTKSYQPATLNASSQYEISNAGQLYWFAALVNGDESVCTGNVTQNTSANAVLTKDIDCGSKTWTPIGFETPYEGTFDGQGHTISGLYSDNSVLNNVGLFGINSGTIKNVGVVDSYFCGNENVGGVCGRNDGGTITGCYNTGSVSVSGSIVGGVCGLNGGRITGCYNIGTVSGNNQVGGVCGKNIGTITGCYNTELVSGNNQVGGVCGENGSTITGCYNTGTVNGYQNYVGGVCGYNHVTITGCYNSGEVSGNEYVGGVCGYNGGIITGCYTNNEIVCGNNNSNVTDCGENTNFTNGAVCSRLNTALKKVNASVRFYREGENYPELIMNVPSLAEDVYQISNKEELYAFALLVNNGEKTANAVLTADIVVNSGLAEGKTMLESLEYDAVSGKVTNGSSFVAWTPMGYYKSDDDYVEYKGTFDGQGHTISGLYFNDVNASYVGLFGRNSGTIKNVGVIDSYFCGNNQVGGVCGNNVNGGTISDCYNMGSVGGNNKVGGVCGENGGTIIGCYNTGSVSGNSNIGGGVCGENGGTITGCYNTGTVSGNDYVGGVCGYNNGGTITGCYSTGSVSGNYLSGGVCGYNEGTITNCYYLASNDDGNSGKTNNQFKSGEVAYLLSQGSTVVDKNTSTYYSGSVWGQQLGTDDYPVLSDYKVIKAAEGDNKTYWATFSNQSSDMVLSGLTVYTATVSKGILTLTPCTDNIVAKGEGVLVKGNSEYLNALMLNDKTETPEENNDLVATPAEPAVIDAATGHVLYRLTYNNSTYKTGLGFYLSLVKDGNNNVIENSVGSQLKATPGKAYLDVTTEAATPSSSNAPALGFAFPSDGETTGISEMVIKGNAGICGAANADGRIYNLQGQQVSAPAKGLYIKNHKKVIVK